jgi:L-asparagine oxygenase
MAVTEAHPAGVRELSHEERERVGQLLDSIVRRHSEVDAALAADAPVHAHQLPAGVRRTLVDLRAQESSPICVLRGNPIDDEALGPTPTDLSRASLPEQVRRMEILVTIYAALLGEVFGWTSQQEGRLVHDVMPIPGREDDQIGFSSRAPLSWHTEDAFSEHRPDYVVLLCLRNPDAVATMVGAVDQVQIPDRTKAVLMQPRFLIRPDESHAADHVKQASVLFGEMAQPYLRIDPDFTIARPGDREAAAALTELSHQLDAGMVPLVLEPGDLCVLDNYRVVHGRRSFRARGDGYDRWLKRVLVSRDLRGAWISAGKRGRRVIDG